MIYRIFCDESCHLENDKIQYMILGGLLIDDNQYKEINLKIKDLRNRLKYGSEIKWVKISRSKIDMYYGIIDLFLNEKGLKFRAVIVDKNQLEHDIYNENSHDTFYYKMFYYVLEYFICKDTSSKYKIYFDYKDSQSKLKINKLKEVLNNKHYANVDIEMQSIRSHESQYIELVDVLIGAISYKVRNLTSSESKLNVATYLENKTGKNLTKSTSKFEEKFNLFYIDLNHNGFQSC